MRRIYREVECHGMRLRGWPKIEKSGKCLSVAYTLEQGEKGDDDDDDDDDDLVGQVNSK